MKLEMKKIKFAAFASQETNCYEATVYKDGKPWALVGNEGHGGPDFQYPVDTKSGGRDWSELAEVNTFLSTTHEANVYEAQNAGRTYQLTFDFEAWCGARLEEHLYRQDMMKTMRKAALFIDSDGKAYKLQYKGGRTPDQNLFDLVKKDSPEAIILNTLPKEQALVKYIKAQEAA